MLICIELSEMWSFVVIIIDDLKFLVFEVIYYIFP